VANEGHEELIRMPVGTSVDEPIGFPAFGVSVDNNTSLWVELPDVGRFVAPNTSRQISLNGKQGAKAVFRAPPGKTQPATVAGEECILVFTSERLQTTGAQVPSVLAAAVTSPLTLIQDQLLAAPAASIDFTAIPATFINLWLICQLRDTGAFNNVQLSLRFNADAAANYDWEQGSFSGAGAVNGAEAVAATEIQVADIAGALSAANAADSVQVTIENYARGTFQKSLIAHATLKNAALLGNIRRRSTAGWWRSLAIINQITLFTNGGATFATGSRATLYGL
jgi:hypothetical protein